MRRRAHRADGTRISRRRSAPAIAASASIRASKPDKVETTLHDARFDAEGRLLIAQFGRVSVVTAYFPKGSGKERDNSRVPYKLDFYSALFDRVQKLKRRGPVFVVGDYNTAHEAIDLARPKTNEKTSGFLPEERAEMARWMAAGWVDTFRARHPGRRGSLHVVAAMGWRAREERRLADRLRARLADRSGARARCVHLAARIGFRPLPGRHRHRLILAARVQRLRFDPGAATSFSACEFAAHSKSTRIRS